MITKHPAPARRLFFLTIVLSAAGCASHGPAGSDTGAAPIDLRTPESAARAWGSAVWRGDEAAVRAIAYAPDDAHRELARAFAQFVAATHRLRETATRAYGVDAATTLLAGTGSEISDYGRSVAEQVRGRHFRVHGDTAVAAFTPPTPTRCACGAPRASGRST